MDKPFAKLLHNTERTQMKRKSSIHIEAGRLGFLFHNDRTKPTANSIFDKSKNEYSTDAKTAIEIYKNELQKRTLAYVKRTGKNLHKKTITHLSAIVNLNKQHNLEDVKKIANYLEESLGTKVFQIAVHRDEGYVDEETGGKHINYHAHLEFLGLDEQGNSVRRKLTKSYLINLQSEVSKILRMERGINYTAQRKKRPKRLDTYEYKEHAKRKAQSEKETLAKVKDLKEENKKLREQLKELGAKREHYANLEQFVKQLKEQIKEKELTIKQLKEQMNFKEQELLKEVEKLKEKVYSNVKYKDADEYATWAEVAEYFKKKLIKEKKRRKELEEELINAKKELSKLKELRYIEKKKREDEIKELKEQIKELKQKIEKSTRQEKLILRKFDNDEEDSSLKLNF